MLFWGCYCVYTFIFHINSKLYKSDVWKWVNSNTFVHSFYYCIFICYRQYRIIIKVCPLHCSCCRQRTQTPKTCHISTTHMSVMMRQGQWPVELGETHGWHIITWAIMDVNKSHSAIPPPQNNNIVIIGKSRLVDITLRPLWKLMPLACMEVFSVSRAINSVLHSLQCHDDHYVHSFLLLSWNL